MENGLLAPQLLAMISRGMAVADPATIVTRYAEVAGALAQDENTMKR